MSEQDIIDEILYQEEKARCYNESIKAYDWLVTNIYAKEDTRR